MLNEIDYDNLINHFTSQKPHFDVCFRAHLVLDRPWVNVVESIAISTTPTLATHHVDA